MTWKAIKFGAATGILAVPAGFVAPPVFVALAGVSAAAFALAIVAAPFAMLRSALR